MIPDNIRYRYTEYENPYRCIFVNENDYIACDFSDMIPAWKIEHNFVDPNLLSQAIAFAERKKYFDFYLVTADWAKERAIEEILVVATNYTATIEEKIPANEKSINILFWDWLCDNTCFDEDVFVVRFTNVHRA